MVFGINLLSRPEQEWEGIVTVKGVTEPNCYIAQMEKEAFKPTTANITSQEGRPGCQKRKKPD